MLPGKSYTPEEVLRILWRHKWLISIPFALSVVLTFAVVRRMPKLYRSETVILVVPQRVPESYVRATVTSRIEDRLNSISSQILSRSRLEPIIRDFALYPEMRSLRTMEEVVEAMRSQITVRVERGDAFRVGYVNKDPRTAQRVTERLAGLFIAENLRDREVQAEGTNQFLEEQLEEARRNLVEKEKKLEAYKGRNAGQLPEHVSINLQSIQTARIQLQALSESIDRDRDRRILLEKQIADAQQPGTIQGLDPAPVGTPGRDGASSTAALSTARQLELAQNQMKELRLRYTPEHPDMIAAERQVRDLEAKLLAESAQTPAAAPQPVQRRSPAELVREARLRDLRAEVQGIDTQLTRKLAEQQLLQTTIAGYQAKVDAAPSREAELTELTRDYATLQLTYTNLLAKREEAKVAANLERNQVGQQFKVLDPAREPERPFSPDVLKLNAIGAMLGLGFGLACAALLEYRDSSFKNEQEILRVLELPVLAQVPMIITAVEQRRHRRLVVAAVTFLIAATSAAAAAIWTLQRY